jgi:D-serine deaminase-like pyridoxal phosphate-dependent protein
MTSRHKKEAQSLSVPAGLVTPTLVVDLDILDRNLAEMAGICKTAGIELWPHAKTHRTVEYGRRQLAAGATGLTVARLEEAEAFAAAGAVHVLVAYPLVGQTKLTRAGLLAQQADLTLATDSLAGARAMGRHFRSLGRTVPAFLIINTGMNRDGVTPQEASSLAHEMSNVEGIRLRGIMTHEGSVYAAENRNDLLDRCQQVAETMVALGHEIGAAAQPLETVSLGASASARLVAMTPGVTQLRPGIYAFNDLGQVALGNASTATCAARVVATVVSSPAPGRALIDAGSKSLSSDGIAGRGAERYPGFGLLADLPGWQLYQLSEEHGWLRWTSDGPPTPLQIGQLVQVVPNHICSVFWNMGVSTGISHGTTIGSWRTIDRNTLRREEQRS